MSESPVFADEERLRRALRRNRAFATGLLGIAAAVFLGTSAIPLPGFWLALIHAGAEAALVGGLADWFAVTALFRHPLGLPIPRTAIIPKNKDRIGNELGQFVERNFLAPDILAAKLAELAPVRHAADWLALPDNAGRVALAIGEALPPVIRSLEDRALRDFVARSFHEQLRETELAPALGRLVALLTRSGQYDALFDRALDAAHAMVAANADRLYAMVAERSRWWVPRTIDRRHAGSSTSCVAMSSIAARKRSLASLPGSRSSATIWSIPATMLSAMRRSMVRGTHQRLRSATMA